jgi:hypothetical protein
MSLSLFLPARCPRSDCWVTADFQELVAICAFEKLRTSQRLCAHAPWCGAQHRTGFER